MVDAVNLISTERGNIEVAITDNTFVPEEAAAVIRDYAVQGYDLVIAHGSQYGTALPGIATEFPEVAFAWGTASDTFGLPNVYAYDAAAEQGGYVQGAMSSLLSGTGTIGVVGPIEVGDAQRYINGFKAGAQAQTPTANVLVAYTGSFSDTTLAAETAQSHIGAGADVMTGSAQMVIGAVSIASENNVKWFGTQANQASLAPTLVVSSQVYHWEVILRQIVAAIDAGTATGGNYTADLANGGLVIEYNGEFQLPEQVRQRADQITGEIANGVIAVPA
jgi:basic membrane protein A